MNEFYTHGSYPATGSAGASAGMRSELDAVSAGFDKLPVLSTNANRVVMVNGTGNSLVAAASLPVAAGGTGGTTAADARTNLGAAGSGANTDITSLGAATGVTAVTQAKNDQTNKLATCAFANPGNSLSGIGYQKLPSGLTLQWGAVTVSGSAVVSFPVTFTTVYQVVGFPEYATAPSNAYCSTNGINNTGFGAIVSGGTLTVRWMAVGFI